MLHVSDLSVSFRRYSGLFRQVEQPCLTGVSFRLRPGEVLAVIGSSGAGKSILAHAILGLLPANAVLQGHVRLGGRATLLPQSTAHLDPLASAGRQIGRAADRAGRRPAVAPALAEVGLAAGVAPLRPHELSTGMARRVMLAAALAQKAGLIVADEPTAGLDPHHRDVILDRLRTEAERGAAVLLITHDLSPALARADRVAVMEKGVLAAVEPARAFVGAGDGLSPTARRLWRALPENGFLADA